MNKQLLIYSLIGAALGYMTGPRGKAAKKKKAMIFGAAAAAAVTFGPRYGVALPQIG